MTGSTCYEWWDEREIFFIYWFNKLYTVGDYPVSRKRAKTNDNNLRITLILHHHVCLGTLRVTSCCLKHGAEHALQCPLSESAVTSHSVLRVCRDPSWTSWHIKRVTRSPLPDKVDPAWPDAPALCCASWMLQHFSILLSPALLSGTEAQWHGQIWPLSPLQ